MRAAKEALVAWVWVGLVGLVRLVCGFQSEAFSYGFA
jgi:hypothetical protein